MITLGEPFTNTHCDMNTLPLFTLIILGLAVLALLIFLIVKNKKDRKKNFPSSSGDAVEVDKMDKERKRDRI